jgi:hypothetical protein
MTALRKNLLAYTFVQPLQSVPHTIVTHSNETYAPHPVRHCEERPNSKRTIALGKLCGLQVASDEAICLRPLNREASEGRLLRRLFPSGYSNISSQKYFIVKMLPAMTGKRALQQVQGRL